MAEFAEYRHAVLSDIDPVRLFRKNQRFRQRIEEIRGCGS